MLLGKEKDTMVSMKDIAKQCNVSVATVSKALNNHKDIGEKTKSRIKETASNMGYYPNAAARALKTNRSYNIGVLFNDNAHSGLTHEYFSEVLEGVKVEAEIRGYDITFINTHNVHMTYYEHCKYRDLDGVVIACADYENPEVMELVNGLIPTVTIDYTCNNSTSVISNNVKGMEELVEYICSKGHKRIAYIHGEIDSMSMVTRDRLAAFYKKLQEFGICVPEEYVKTSKYLDPVMAEQATYELLDLNEPPTCILYPDDLSVTGGNNAAKSRGITVPEDISFVGYDGTKLSQMLSPKLTTMRQDTTLIGKKAAIELIYAIENPKTALIKRIVVEGKIIIGESVGEVVR